MTTLNISAAPVPGRSTGQRLMRAFYQLQNIQLVRDHRRDPNFGRCAEDRIIWRELLDLELQDADERIEQIAAAAGAFED